MNKYYTQTKIDLQAEHLRCFDCIEYQFFDLYDDTTLIIGTFEQMNMYLNDKIEQTK